ncbi:MAG: DUF2512 family protein [Bacillota bacterium]
MNRTMVALAVKFVLTLIFAGVAFMLVAGNSLGPVVVVAVAVTVVNYLVGDLGELPSYGNIWAAVGDGVMGAIVSWLAALLIPAFLVTLGSLALFAVLTGVTEFYFHRYLMKDEKVAP